MHKLSQLSGEPWTGRGMSFDQKCIYPIVTIGPLDFLGSKKIVLKKETNIRGS